MSWAGPDREFGPPSEGSSPKPFCAHRPESVTDKSDEYDVESYVLGRGLSWGVAKYNGWYASRNAGDTELRVVIPCLSANLTNKYWQARLVRDTKEKFPLRYESPHRVSRGDALCVVYPTKNIFGVVLAEGPMDALAAAEVDYIGIAWMGTSPGIEPINFARKLVRPLASKPLLVVSDEGALNAAVAIWRHFPGAFLVEPHPYKDLAEMPKGERSNLLRGTG